VAFGLCEDAVIHTIRHSFLLCLLALSPIKVRSPTWYIFGLWIFFRTKFDPRKVVGNRFWWIPVNTEHWTRMVVSLILRAVSACVQLFPHVFSQSTYKRPVNSNYHKAACTFYRHFKLFISVINQLDAQNLCITISLFHCITQPLVSSQLYMWWYQSLCNAILISWWWAHVLETCRGMK